MRVITGKARGRRLKEPQGMDIRPTTDMVKESLFNIIQCDIEGRQVLDLFAGTGQLGIEALSRGAASVTFVDASPAAVRLVRDNLEHTGLEGGRIVQSDALSYLNSGEKYDLIFLDPPYSEPLLEKALLKITEFDKLNERGIIVCESPVGKELPALAAPYGALRSYQYGKVKLTLYTRTGE